MKARDVMNDQPRTCKRGESLSSAVALMRDANLGFLPVLDDETGRLVGVITDRDICLTAAEHDRPLSEIAVEGAMHTDVHTCHANDSMEDVLFTMKNYRVRRVPIVGKRGRLKGVVALSDLARLTTAKKGPKAKEVASALATIYEARSAAPYA